MTAILKDHFYFMVRIPYCSLAKFRLIFREHDGDQVLKKVIQMDVARCAYLHSTMNKGHVDRISNRLPFYLSWKDTYCFLFKCKYFL